MQVKIEDSWRNILQSEFEKPYFKTLVDFVKSEYKQHICYPKSGHIFAAFDNCNFHDLRVVIIGQDPYHVQNQANGLCFSVNDGVAHPPSLKNIFKELSTDLQVTYPQSGNLEKWAKQGVLLLNATLTVRENEAGSHQKKGWETFTDAVIQKVSTEKEGVVFLLWGGFAKQKTKIIDVKKHCIFTSGHPSPLSANRGFWFGNKHFSKTNKVLENMKKPIIEW
ncbi:MAG: uracil-DNA glycosylase [Flavobacteriia bacterium]|nr:uracil-DNA glycosylase [Flavobacteriia bacterium]OIP45076.1 MAG: uracil-DNA glycosylase [Flavobacteriaceae bacterium CG2_30_31_66]PIV95270.1 MAG: uracil-DNA glycosylase [Flavobacteriaceae bacterium CG17_big_fil_post_rev_8_21_14_2_50_31_13]PIX11400.1 MAG: uracil-DNA glycosylase [Flavobacteriaceae bacterium CG_4_8_14_3_um_filter_31_8]PIY13601.1 MAG: uracil-DNA glycosylase [Flavobacteriaceae bacterium CG_4_10_14_3_um_filter_31_253]PIZ11838.1 MAG: uracil-DNA glycosylase [Flavobacteriaceae bacte